jgi:hypothetical protein
MAFSASFVDDARVHPLTGIALQIHYYNDKVANS